MKLTRLGPGHYEMVAEDGTRLVISQVASAYNRYGQRRKNPRAGNPWRVRNTRIEGPTSIIAEEWTLAAARYAAENFLAKRSTV